MFEHELAYRGEDLLEKINNFRLSVIGVGALGSNLVFNLVKQGFYRVEFVDYDKVEESNIGTQIYGLGHVGEKKNLALLGIVEDFTGIGLSSYDRKIKTLKDLEFSGLPIDLMVDCLDNAETRQLVTDFCKMNKLPCIHAGLHEDYGEIRWNENYIVPQAQGGEVCANPIARNMITLVTSLLAEAIVRYINTGEKLNISISFKDLNISTYLT